MRSGAELESNLAPFQSQARLKPLTGLRREALQHLAATLFQERLGRARRNSLAGNSLPDRELAPTLPAAAAVAFRLIQDLRAAQGAWAQRDHTEARRPSSSGPSFVGLTGGFFTLLRPRPPARCLLSCRPCPPSLPPDRNWDLGQLAAVEQLEDDLARLPEHEGAEQNASLQKLSDLVVPQHEALVFTPQ
jgi:hypothetical protein